MTLNLPFTVLPILVGRALSAAVLFRARERGLLPAVVGMLVIGAEVRIAATPHRFAVLVRMLGPVVSAIALLGLPVFSVLVELSAFLKPADVVRLLLIAMQVDLWPWFAPAAAGILQVLPVMGRGLSAVTVSWIIFFVIHEFLF